MSSEFLIVASRIFEITKTPMRPKDLVGYAIDHKMFSEKIAGQTPHQTMKSKLSVHVRLMGDSSEFVRTGRGRFFLRALLTASQSVYDAKPYAKPYSEERVLVIDGKKLDSIVRFQGIRKTWKRVRTQLLTPLQCRYMDRLSAETDNTHKQILTYVMVTRKNQVLAFKRGNYNRTEDFLRGAHCIGFGGHVADTDLDLFSVRDNDMGVTNCARRELAEELHLPGRDRLRLQEGRGLQLVGLLNDDSSAAGRRHFAFLYRYEVSTDPSWIRPRRGEKSITQLRWIGQSFGSVPLWGFEYWSQLCLREYFRPLIYTAPAFRINRTSPLRLPHVLCVLGRVGSGKSETTRILTEDHSYFEVNSGRVLARLLGLPPVPQTARSRFQEAASEFIRRPNGPSMLAEAICREIELADSERVLIDGIRQRETLELVRKGNGGLRFGILFVHTLPDVAFKFYADRERKGVSIQQFLAVRDAQVENEVEKMITLSDAVLYNWTGKGVYRQAVRQLMRSVSRT